MGDERPVITVHLYPDGVPNVIEGTFDVDPYALIDIAERLESEPHTLITDARYAIAFCVHRRLPEPVPVHTNGDGSSYAE